MVCEFVRTPNGTMIVCGPRRPRPRCQCGSVASFQCDWPTPNRKSGTCDKHICTRCARVAGADTHYCPFHRGAPPPVQAKLDLDGPPKSNTLDAAPAREAVDRCRCNCGYTCGGPGACPLPMLECIEQHYLRDCGHDFTGPMVKLGDGASVSCKRCSMAACDHDMVCGP
jgi:hypothetical protein